MSQPPNILWICTDQQRYDTLGCTGNTFVRTPHVDALASRGVLFERTYCQSPVCTPSRASFLTGRYPRTTRCRQNGQNIPADEVLVTKLLADAGYVCGLAGKLHLSACGPAVCPGMERRIDDGYAEFHWSHGSHPGHASNEYFHWLRERGQRFETPVSPHSEFVRTGMPAEHHQTTWCALKAATFMQAQAEVPAERRRPWLFSVNCYDPHFAFDPPESHLRRYLDRLDEIPLPAYEPGEIDGKPIFHRQSFDKGSGRFRYGAMSDTDHRVLRAAYSAMCDLIDEAVGQMLVALDRTGQADDTIVIFMSDHGEILGDHGLYLKGPFFFEPAVRVPLIVHWPGRIEGGRRVRSLVELTDIAPALLEAAGLPPYPGMQGRSLWPVLTGAAMEHARDDVYCEYLNAMPDHREPQAHCTMLRTERYKIVAAHGVEPGELYDLRADPTETHNYWAEPAYEAIKLEMLKRLCDRIAFTADPLPPRLAPY